MHFDEDPLMYWKKKSEELPTLATLAKDYLGLTATSAPSERISSIADSTSLEGRRRAASLLLAAHKR
ncbi:unnamed protein product [Clavelina lepadiformis]|uniref:HAT C-terminal dimerisation domain-containing protein n=1 Tax=Clavelina lepadiformis TaxID=159417 RepID=A0ABP0GJQ3_CLALP